MGKTKKAVAVLAAYKMWQKRQHRRQLDQLRLRPATEEELAELKRRQARQRRKGCRFW